jgi:hypothetical protein
MPQLFRRHSYTAARVGKLYDYGDQHTDLLVGEMTVGGWDFPLNQRGRPGRTVIAEFKQRLHALRIGQVVLGS